METFLSSALHQEAEREVKEIVWEVQ